MGRLERHLDPDAVARVLAGIKPEPKNTLTRQKTPRGEETYRGARRNFWRQAGGRWGLDYYGEVKIKHRPNRYPVRPNRSSKWDHVALAQAAE